MPLNSNSIPLLLKFIYFMKHYNFDFSLDHLLKNILKSGLYDGGGWDFPWRYDGTEDVAKRNRSIMAYKFPWDLHLDYISNGDKSASAENSSCVRSQSAYSENVVHVLFAHHHHKSHTPHCILFQSCRIPISRSLPPGLARVASKLPWRHDRFGCHVTLSACRDITGWHLCVIIATRSPNDPTQTGWDLPFSRRIDRYPENTKPFVFRGTTLIINLTEYTERIPWIRLENVIL